MISRSAWGANPASLPASSMRLPATEVWIHHSVTAVTDNPAADMRSIERIGLSRFGQFSYSYIIHPHDGEILEGCGLRRGAHTAQRNSTSFGICWAGNYDTRAPKAQQIAATRRLIADLKAAGHLVAGAPIRGHRDVFATACPGAKLYAILDTIRRPAEVQLRPDYDPPLEVASFLANPNGPGGWGVSPDGGILAFGGAPVIRGPNGKPYFEGRVAAHLTLSADGRPIVIATSGERYGPDF